MAQGKFVAHCRVSTAKQGRSGLGLEAQQEAVRSYLIGGAWQLVDEVVEVESGKRNDRSKLAEALRVCRARAWVRTILVVTLLSSKNTRRCAGISLICLR